MDEHDELAVQFIMLIHDTVKLVVQKFPMVLSLDLSVDSAVQYLPFMPLPALRLSAKLS